MRRRLAPVVLSAVTLGLVIAVVPQGNERLSIDLWLATTSGWLAGQLTRDTLGVAPRRPERWRLPLVWHRRSAVVEGPVPRDLPALEGALLAARDSDRAFALRLRPRLVALADHRLRVERGIDPDRQPERVAAALGDVAWLIDPTVTDRSPRADELTRFLDRLDGSAPTPPPSSNPDSSPPSNSPSFAVDQENP